MKYSAEEKIDIGRRVYNGEFAIADAAKEFEVCEATIENYIFLYRKKHHLPPRKCGIRVKKTL